MSNQIDDAIAEAEAAAAQVQEPTALVTTTGQGSTAVGAPVDMSLGSFLKSGGISPDKWLQVDKFGLKIDKNEKALIEEFEANLDFSTVKMFVGMRIKLPGNKYEYIKSYDGRTESRTGQNWNAAVAEANARAAEPAQTYRGADILLVPAKDVLQGKTTIPAGTKLGYTTSITGFGAFQTYLAELVGKNAITVGAGDVLSGVVNTKVSHETKKNADYEWGILNFATA